MRERWDKQTCHWIRTEPKFSAWLDSEESDILWIHGPSGMGKSVLCGYIIDEILRKPRQIATSQGETKTVEAVPEGNILWFYCTGDNHLQASRSEIIKSFVRQIYLAHWPRSDLDNEPDPEIRSKSNGIVQFIAKNFRSDDFTRLNEPDVMQKFESLFMRLADSPIYVLLDGLDEFSQEHDMDVEGVWEYLWRFHDKVFESLDVATFQHIEESALPKSPSSKITIKVLLLSRPLHRLMLKCENPTPTDIPISDLDLPLRQVREDVQKYLRARVREKLSQLADAPSLQQDDTALSAKVNDIVHKMLPDTAGSSLFLWAFYMSQEINECHSTASIEDICRHDHFPTVTAKSSSFSAASAVTLRAYYTHVLHRMYSRLPAHPEEQKAVSRALLWVTYAANTLSVRQLSQVPSQAPLGSSKDLAAAIRRYLGSFVQAPHLTQGDPGVDRPDNMLRLTHYSVAEYMRTITPEEQWAKFSADSDIAITTPSNSHSKLLEDCLLYLEDEAFNKPFVNIRGSATLRKHLDNEGRHAFFAYAATNWTYHLTRVTDRADAKRCSDAMERFFKSPSLKGWMEGSITLYGGCEWITTLVAMVEKWFRDRGFNPESQCKPFQDWVSDVTNIKFEDYEQTLLYNNNEVHFLDVGRLLPRTSRHFPPTEGDVLHPLEEDAASTKEESWHLDATGSIPHLALARKLPEGEDGENMIGYLSLDRNDEANRGLLSIDLKCNHPRLVWEQIIFGPHGGTGERQVGNDGSGNSKAKNRRLRLSSVIPLTRSKAHSQFTALSAALSEDGNKLAAVYREEVDSKTIKLRVILWTFKHTKRADQIGGEFLAGWKAGLDSRMTDIEKSLVTLYHATETRVKFRTGAREIDPGAAADAKKIVEDLCNGPAFKRVKEVAQTLGARPALPSMEPLEEGLPWAEAEELEQCCYGRGEMKVSAASPCADSRYLVAFWDSQTLITPSGVFDLEQKKTLKNRNFHGLENGDFGKSFVLAPMGRFLLSTAEKKLTVVDLDPFREPWIRSRRYWDASQLGEGVRIVSVLDCSPSGCMASLHVEKTFVKDGKRACTLGVVVVDLSSLAFSLVFCQTVTGRRLGIIRTVFCPRDNHLAIASQEAEEGSLGPSRYSIWVANITAGTCSLLETRTLMPHAMVYLQCNDTGCLSPSDENTEKTKQPEAQALSESMSNLLRLRLQDIEYVRKPMRKPWAFDPSHFKSNGIINDGARGMRLDNRSLREGIDKMLSRLLDASSLFGNIRSPYHRDPPEACKKTVIGVVLEDRTVHLLEFHNTLPSSKHEMTLEDLPLVTAICRPSWTREEISAAWMQFSLKRCVPASLSTKPN